MIKLRTLPECINFCATIGNLPSSYMQSLTYEEQILWLCKFLETEVLPAFNNNTAAVEELQNWFNNLDVQEEINNKLNEMAESGQLQEVIADYINIPEIESNIQNIQNSIGTIQNNINIINDNIDNVENDITQNTIDIGANKTALESKISAGQTNSISMEMLGNDVREAITGGSVAVVGENSIDFTNIKDNGVDLLNLSNNLQSNLNKLFTKINLQNPSSGYWTYNSSTNKATLSETTRYQYYQLNLTKGTLYKFLALNSYGECGIIIVDTTNNNDVIYTSDSNNTQGQSLTGVYIRANKTGLKALISFPTNETWTSTTTWLEFANIFTSAYYLSDTEVRIKDYEKKYLMDLVPIKTIDDAYITVESHTDDTTRFVFPRTYVFTTIPATRYHIKQYYIQKGDTFNITSFNAYTCAGIVITNLSGSITYKSSSSNVSGYEQVDREFTASEDGYLFISYSDTHLPRVQKYTPFGDDETLLKNKTLYGDGDSVAYGDQNNGKSYLNYIAENNSMVLTKKAVNGTCIAKRNGYTNSILERVKASIGESYDYVLIEGGYNDIFQNIPIGTLSSGYDDTLDEYTFTGAMESLCKTLVTGFSNSKFLFIIGHKKVNEYASSQEQYWEVIRAVCKKWSIPYVDLAEKSGLLPINQTLLDLYFADNVGTHPSELGFKTFYVDSITSAMRNR